MSTNQGGFRREGLVPILIVGRLMLETPPTKVIERPVIAGDETQESIR